MGIWTQIVPPAVQWEQTYGGAGNQAGRVSTTADDGYVVAGIDNNDVLLARFDSEGRVVWRKVIGGESVDAGFAVEQTADGGFIVAGRTESFGTGRFDYYLFKTDPAGKMEWQNTYGGSDDEFGQDVQQTAEGGYMVFGWSRSFSNGQSDFYIVNTDGTGEMLWQNNFGNQSNDLGASAEQTQDGGYILGGSSDVRSYLVRIGSAGDLLWERVYTSLGTSAVTSIKETLDGSFVAAGWVEPDGKPRDILLFKVNANGELLWDKRFGGPGDDYGESIVELVDRGFVIAGLIDTQGIGGTDAYLLRTDALGELGWDAAYGVRGDEWASSVQITSDIGYVIAGKTEFDFRGQKENDGIIVKYARDPKLQPFRRCDANDDGHYDIADSVWLIYQLFYSGLPVVCLGAGDCNSDAIIDISDAMYALNHNFLGGPRPRAPFPGCGMNSAADAMGCPPGSVSNCK